MENLDTIVETNSSINAVQKPGFFDGIENYLRGLCIAAAVTTAYFASGCASLAQREIPQIREEHGVHLDITSGAVAADFLGGNSLIAVRNIDKELENFPYEAKKLVKIHLVGQLELLGQARNASDVLATPLVIGATQDHPGKTQGDIFITNKGLWSTYLDIPQPNTIMLQDPHLRHEFVHAYEIKSLQHKLFCDYWQQILDQDPEMVFKLNNIDAISLLAKEEDIATREFRPYVYFCARWIASMFGDVTGDKRVDEEDMRILRADPLKFDSDGDGRIGYEDAVSRTGIAHSDLSGINPITQMEMGAGLFGYRPKGFASAYGRTAYYEDKAEVSDFAIRKRILPQLYRKGKEREIEKAYRLLEEIREKDPVFARKLEDMALLWGNLEYPENRNNRFDEIYGPLMVPFNVVCPSRN